MSSYCLQSFDNFRLERLSNYPWRQKVFLHEIQKHPCCLLGGFVELTVTFAIFSIRREREQVYKVALFCIFASEPIEDSRSKNRSGKTMGVCQISLFFLKRFNSLEYQPVGLASKIVVSEAIVSGSIGLDSPVDVSPVCELDFFEFFDLLVVAFFSSDSPDS